jgi:hypothetical protein
MGKQAMGKQAMGKQAMGKQAMGKQAMGKQANGGNARAGQADRTMKQNMKAAGLSGISALGAVIVLASPASAT